MEKTVTFIVLLAIEGSCHDECEEKQDALRCNQNNQRKEQRKDDESGGALWF
jgi:hypothetical protein